MNSKRSQVKFSKLSFNCKRQLKIILQNFWMYCLAFWKFISHYCWRPYCFYWRLQRNHSWKHSGNRINKFLIWKLVWSCDQYFIFEKHWVCQFNDARRDFDQFSENSKYFDQNSIWHELESKQDRDIWMNVQKYSSWK